MLPTGPRNFDFVGPMMPEDEMRRRAEQDVLGAILDPSSAGGGSMTRDERIIDRLFRSGDWFGSDPGVGEHFMSMMQGSGGSGLTPRPVYDPPVKYNFSLGKKLGTPRELSAAYGMTKGEAAAALGYESKPKGEEGGPAWYDRFGSNQFLMSAGAQVAGGLAGGASARDIGLGLLPTIGSAFGPLGAAGGSLLAALIGRGERRADPVMEPIPVKVMNWADMTSEFLKMTGINLAGLASASIDSIANQLRVKEAQVGIEW